uniref:Long-chain-fatty-acid---luciferin-component ligase n=1 Tax=Candidatus Kentrum sp. LFY TaxID=2126342 RepID=A0A450WJQ9_9GAMM|nr:MAG: long-chain-fatty-acid---luciferin-component ligase [Candidatus Kentron sp. LFY]
MAINIEKLRLNPFKLVAASVKELYSLSDEDLLEVKVYLIREAFIHHYERNKLYRDSCIEKGIAPDGIQTIKDLIRIPLVPLEFYKSSDSYKLLSVPFKEVEMESRSTGTSGIPSVSRRCSHSADTALLGISMMYREFFRISKGAGLFICISGEEAPEMAMLKGLNLLLSSLDTSRFMVKETSFSPEDSVDQLSEWKNKFTRHVLGPPFLIKEFLSYLETAGIKLKLDKNSYVVTIGGWKRFTGEMLSRTEFDELCMECLGVRKDQVRDIYGLSESNVFAIDDEFGEKHVSPFAHFSVRDPQQLDRELEIGEPGQLAILDPMMLAQPGFLLTEDVVRLLPGKSKSGRSGQRMEYVERLPDAGEFGCCAIHLDKRMNAPEVASDSDNSCPVV